MRGRMPVSTRWPVTVTVAEWEAGLTRRTVEEPASVPTMAVDLFAGLPVADYERALAWYQQLLGSEPSFLPNDTEAVWEIAENRYVFIEVRPEHAGHAMHTIFAGDFDDRVQAITDRGIEPADRETYS